MRANLMRRLALSLVVAGCGAGTDVEPIDPDTKGMNVLGSGTDVFGPYAVESNVKGRVFDVAAMNDDGLVEYSPDVQESRYQEAQGNTISEYAQSLAVSVGLSGSYKFFAGEIKSSYAENSYRKTGYSYASIIERHWKHSLKLQPAVWTSPARLRGYLTPLARQAINDTDKMRSWSGADVIAAYGTHVMNGIYVGGRLDYHMAVQIMQAQYQQQLMAYAKFSYKAAFVSADLTATMDSGMAQTMDSYNRVTTTNAKGGAAQYANPANDADYRMWKASLEVNPVFCGIIDGGLLPIWELADSPARQTELRTAYEAYARGQDAAFIPLNEKITDLEVIDAGQSTSVTPSQGYKLLANADGATIGGATNFEMWNDLRLANYVFIAYRAEVTAEPRGIREVHVSSPDPATVDLFFGGSGGQGHNAIYGAGQPGCQANASMNLNSGACGVSRLSSHYDVGCFRTYYSAACDAAATPLALHFATETETHKAVRCLAVGDEIAADVNQPEKTRVEHLYFAPADANQDGKADYDDGVYVLEHVAWLRRPDGKMVNLNHGARNLRRYSWVGCLFGGGYTSGWNHAAGDPQDAQYIGTCAP